MAETFSWPEGQVYLWTGSAQKTAVGFAKSTDIALQYGYINQQAGGVSSYYNYLTGQRADITIEALLTNDGGILRIGEARTAVHMKLENKYQTGITGSAGILLWSGVINGFNTNGTEGNAYSFRVSYHANTWSAYGLTN